MAGSVIYKKQPLLTSHKVVLNVSDSKTMGHCNHRMRFELVTFEYELSSEDTALQSIKMFQKLQYQLTQRSKLYLLSSRWAFAHAQSCQKPACFISNLLLDIKCQGNKSTHHTIFFVSGAQASGIGQVKLQHVGGVCGLL